MYTGFVCLFVWDTIASFRFKGQRSQSGFERSEFCSVALWWRRRAAASLCGSEDVLCCYQSQSGRSGTGTGVTFLSFLDEVTADTKLKLKPQKINNISLLYRLHTDIFI